MDAQTLYSQWKQYKRLPDMDTVVDFTIAGKRRELEFVAKLYASAGATLDISRAMLDTNILPLLLKQIPVVWNDAIRQTMTISRDILDKHADIRVFVGVSDAEVPTPPNSPKGASNKRSEVDALAEQMSRMTLIKSADEYIAERSKRGIATMARMTGSHVSMNWVRQCASKLVVDSPDLPLDTAVDARQFILLREDSDRHVHHVNRSVIAFLKALGTNFVGDDGLRRTLTWQFSHESAFAIHLEKFNRAAAELCPDSPDEFIIFACAAGIPIHELMKTRDIITTWKSSRFKIFSQENVVKTLLRTRFDTEATDIETNRLVRKYLEHIDDFQVVQDFSDIDMYFYKKFYSYPSAEEIEHLTARIRRNTYAWTGHV